MTTRKAVDKADTDHGWHKVADDLREATVCADFTASERVVLGWVEAMTYGRKLLADGKMVPLKMTPFTWRRVARDTGRSIGRIHEAGHSLIDSKVLVVDRRGWVGYNTRVALWDVTILGGGFRSRMGVVTADDLEKENGGGPPANAKPHRGASGSSNGQSDQVGAKTRPQAKGRPLDATVAASFERIYAIYPRKDGKAMAAKVWAAIGLGAEDVVLAGIRRDCRRPDWNKDAHRWVPKLDRWLKERRWEDSDGSQASAKTSTAQQKCRVCHSKQTAAGAKWCADCSWCFKCDKEGRESTKPPAQLKERKEGGLMCLKCAGQ